MDHSLFALFYNCFINPNYAFFGSMEVFSYACYSVIFCLILEMGFFACWCFYNHEERTPRKQIISTLLFISLFSIVFNLPIKIGKLFEFVLIVLGCVFLCVFLICLFYWSSIGVRWVLRWVVSGIFDCQKVEPVSVVVPAKIEDFSNQRKEKARIRKKDREISLAKKISVPDKRSISPRKNT